MLVMRALWFGRCLITQLMAIVREPYLEAMIIKATYLDTMEMDLLRYLSSTSIWPIRYVFSTQAIPPRNVIKSE